MARGHRLNTSIVLAAVHGLSGLFRAVSAIEPSLCQPLTRIQRSFGPRLGSVLPDIVITTNQSLASSNDLKMELIGLINTGSIGGVPVNRSYFRFYVGGKQLVVTIGLRGPYDDDDDDNGDDDDDEKKKKNSGHFYSAVSHRQG